MEKAPLTAFSPLTESGSLPEMTESVRALFEMTEADHMVSFEDETVYYLNLAKLINRAKKDGVSNIILHDAILLVVSLQGIVNREKPRLVIEFICNEFAGPFQGTDHLRFETDKFWLEELQKEGGYLSSKHIVEVYSIEKLVCLFGFMISGAVVWDPLVPATMNVASTVAGADDLLPLRYDTGLGVFDWFVRRKQLLQVGCNLNGLFTGDGTIPDTELQSSKSKKCDAYLWAKALYLDTGKTNPLRMKYVNDAYPWGAPGQEYPDLENINLVNRDYYVAEKAFFVDLSPVEGQTPNDDPTQPAGTDYRTLCEILRKHNELAQGQIITVGGFEPWWIKYTSMQNPEFPNCVSVEWISTYLFSRYYAQLDSDAGKGLSNCSVTRNIPLRKQYTQNPKPAKRPLENKHYICFYMSDYDSSAWLASLIPQFWNAEARGKLPLAWGFNSCLWERIPHVIDYMYRNRSDKDYFVMADSGTGYFTVEALLDPQRPDGLYGTPESWIAHNRAESKHFDLDIGAYFITQTPESNLHICEPGDTYIEDTPIPMESLEVYAAIAPGGVGVSWPKPESDCVQGVPVVSAPMASSSQVYDPAYIADFITRYPGAKAKGATFGLYRCTWTSPDRLYEALNLLQKQDEQYEAVDPYTFFALYRQALSE